MSETVETKIVETETQIHVTGISIAAPIGQEMSATASFSKARVDPETGDVIQRLPWDSETDGLPQVPLDQTTILGLITPERFVAVRDALHEKRKEPLVAAAKAAEKAEAEEEPSDSAQDEEFEDGE